jgi:glutamate receptor, ionotropic, invertebrate
MNLNIFQVHTTDNHQGVRRVVSQKGQYAFLMESVPMEYQINRNCNLIKIGENLDSKGYGIAFSMSELHSMD